MGSWEGCLELYKYYWLGKRSNNPEHGVVEKDTAKAFECLTRACALKNPKACMEAAMMLKLGHGVPKDEALGEEFRNKAMEIMRAYTEDASSVVFGEQHNIKKNK